MRKELLLALITLEAENSLRNPIQPQQHGGCQLVLGQGQVSAVTMMQPSSQNLSAPKPNTPFIKIRMGAGAVA